MVNCVFMVGRLVYETEPLICGILASEIYATTQTSRVPHSDICTPPERARV